MSWPYLLRLFAVLLFLVVLVSPTPAQKPDSAGASLAGNATIRPGQKLIAEAALSLVGRPSLALEDKTFPWDCSGTVLASLWSAGLNVNREYGAFSGNGVKRLYEIAVAHQLEYDLPLPEIGDIIFWDNTYDHNGDLKWNDNLTHTGIVVAVDANGTITYVHHDYRRGIVTARMNLLYPLSQYGVLADGTKIEINSPLRMNSDRYLNPSRWLSSHLFRGFGRLHLMLDEKLLSMLAAAAPASKP